MIIEGLFDRLPVRRKELEKNVKREYAKVIGLLHSYACVSTGVKLTVKNSTAKARNSTIFATNGNGTTRENIANVYGTKSLSALVKLELSLDLPSKSSMRREARSDTGTENSSRIHVQGYISRPIHGEGRLAPDRQMFFVNSRPCGLPQISKAFNEVYRSFNASQSPFIFADFKMDTNAYDVNVSPDKRTILIHDSDLLIENLKASLIGLFESEDQTMPQSQLLQPKLPAFRKLSVPEPKSVSGATSVSESISLKSSSESGESDNHQESMESDQNEQSVAYNAFNQFFRNQASTRDEQRPHSEKTPSSKTKPQWLKTGRDAGLEGSGVEGDEAMESSSSASQQRGRAQPRLVQDFNERIAVQANQSYSPEPQLRTDNDDEAEEPVPALSQEAEPGTPNVVQNAFDRMRRKRVHSEIATITIGDNTVTTVLGSQMPKRQRPLQSRSAGRATSSTNSASQMFGRGLRGFAAPRNQPDIDSEDASEEEVGEEQPSEEERSEASSLSDKSEAVYQDQASESQNPGVTSNANSPDESGEGEDHVSSKAGVSDQNETENLDAPAEIENSSDEGYLDERDKQAQEKAKVEELIRRAEENAARPTEDNVKRATKALKGGGRKDSTTPLVATIEGVIEDIERQALQHKMTIDEYLNDNINTNSHVFTDEDDPEERLSLTVSKADFSKMQIIGQFNMGFVLSRRQNEEQQSPTSTNDLFIIDQHASDEKYNFERLQRETTVGNQRLVQAKTLDLTAVEEEIIMENIPAMDKNGFNVEIDTSGKSPTGRRCKLVSLPLSKEVVFGVQDLEELIHLLSENPVVSADSVVPRPSKVRKMFAMRACRSSVMIGKTLTTKQMATIVNHMGEIDKPWNCPHGRPTMRHLLNLKTLRTWQEGDGLPESDGQTPTHADIWQAYAAD